MSRLRWTLAGVLAVIAAVAAVQALLTYIEHHILVGVLATLALMITLVAGLTSLGQARRRIERELQGLRARPARGELVNERRRRLEVIKAAGARPDLDSLAETTAAEEAGRAYIGRYLVATTVLIGLVGTFAGLMETLGKVSPLLSETGSGGLALLAAPLAGLHVTFGASLVAILATLALALAQGDLALHEELALAALRDLTTHELIPQLWPAGEERDGADRTVAAIVDLKQTFGDALVRSLEKSAGRLAAETRSESERAARALESAAQAVEKQITRLADTLATNLAEGSRRQTAAIVEGAGIQTDSLTKHAAAVTDALTKNAAAQAQVLDQLRAQLNQALEASLAKHDETLINATNSVAVRLGDATTATLATLRSEWEGAITRTSAVAAEAVRDSLSANEVVLRRAVETAGAASLRATEAGEQAAVRGAAAAEQAAARGAAAAEDAVQRTLALCEEALRGLSERLGSSVEPLFATEAGRLEAVRETLTEISLRLETAGGRLTEMTGVVAELGRNHTSALEETGKSVLGAFDKAVLGGSAALDGAAGVLAKAALDLRAGTEGFAPTLGQLSNELGALGREVALLAARAPESDSSLVVLAELERLGTGVDRLTKLAELAQPGTTAVTEIAETATAAAAVETVTALDEPDLAIGDDAIDPFEAAVAAAGLTAEIDAVDAGGQAEIEVEDASAQPAAVAVNAAGGPVRNGGRGKRKSRARDRAPEATPELEQEPAASDAQNLTQDLTEDRTEELSAEAAEVEATPDPTADDDEVLSAAPASDEASDLASDVSETSAAAELDPLPDAAVDPEEETQS